MLAKFLRAKIARLSLVGFLTLFIVIGGAWFASLEASSTKAAEVKCPPAPAGKIYRFLEGPEPCLTPLSNSQIEQLNDPFAKGLLRKGVFPESTDALNKDIKAQLGYDPVYYVVGEGAQIPTKFASREEGRGLRYLVTWGANENEGKIMMSKLAPGTKLSMIEVISFDPQSKEYNYYLLRPQVPDFYATKENPFVWAWTGNGSMAQQPPVMGHGCFRCHHNGTPVMREIEFPWSNWQSQRANISSALVPKAVASESFFLPRRGGEIFEGVIRGNIQEHYTYWLGQRLRKEGSTTNISDVDKMLRHLTTNTTINFKSSDVQSNGADTSPPNLDIAGVPPNDTFLADTLLQTTLKLNYSSLSVKLPRDKYDAYLKEHNFALVGTKGFTRDTPEAYRAPGSTYFAFYVPQVPAEDIYVTQQLLRSNIVTDKFAAAILMVDFKNPLFSEKRASLQKYAQQIKTGKIVSGVSSVPEDFAAKIKQTGAKACQSDNFDACSAEEQFLYTWELPDQQWKQVMAKMLQSHVDSVANMNADERLDYLMRWSIQQRDRFAKAPALCEFFESRLLFPETSLSQLPTCPTTLVH